MANTLKGRVALVTGAARGIGAAIAEALLQNGCKVCLVDILEAEGKTTCEKLKTKYGGETVCFRYTDVTEVDSFEGTFQDVIRQWGPITVFVSNAGVIDEKDFAKTIDVNLVSSIRAANIGMKYMGKDNGGEGGNLIFTASLVGLFPYGPLPAYTASKFGVVALAKCYASHQYENSGITFSAICPGLTNTTMGDIVVEIERTQRTSLPCSGTIANRLLNQSTPELIAGGVIQLLKDNRNGAVLLAHIAIEGHYRYLSDDHLDPVAILGATRPAQGSEQTQ
ncbi:15-hydroxyprostaglandin dehydrogenase [NAD(+)]-like [Ornithodoros turicata]|uniref:15-hydroxyprostaglandin dehydrogenase [NAD(+)]-like n=1 Tax=Ornithodoros turicata TaxID=34597 RepID=UPI003138F34D